MKLFGFILFLFSCGTAATEQDADLTRLPETDNTYSLQVFINPDSSFAYSIRKGQDNVIVQKHIPAKPGLAGFKDSISALKVGSFVLDRIIKGNWPPTVQGSEIDSILKP